MLIINKCYDCVSWCRGENSDENEEQEREIDARTRLIRQSGVTDVDEQVKLLCQFLIDKHKNVPLLRLPLIELYRTERKYQLTSMLPETATIGDVKAIAAIACSIPKESSQILLGIKGKYVKQNATLKDVNIGLQNLIVLAPLDLQKYWEGRR